MVVGQIRVKGSMKGVSDLRLRDLGGVRGLGEGRGDEKKACQENKAQSCSDRVPPRESLSFALLLLSSSQSLLATKVAIMIAQSGGDVKMGA
ncbi:MAG: hypothetical protein C4295_05240 [Candidatus Fervidibacterota bacterium]